MERFPPNDLLQLQRRDIKKFVRIREAGPADDGAIGGLLVRSFITTYALKLPYVSTREERILEYLNVGARRNEGAVMVLELGHRAIGTYSLIRPGARTSQSWLPQAANLRCLAIDPDFHSLGLSSILLESADALARVWDVPDIILHVQKGAEGVARTYERHGYRREASGDLIVFGQTIEAYARSLTFASALPGA